MAIDLRSDTITRPTPGMRAAIAAAEVGDDVFGDDPTVNLLEQRTAELLGHEAGLFVTSGSLGNLLGVRCNADRGQEVLADAQAHVVKYEHGAHAAVHGVSFRTFASVGGRVDADTVAAMITPDDGHMLATAAVAVENTQGSYGGIVQPYDQLAKLSQLCRDAGVRLHLDGARLWNAHVATGRPMSDVGRLFDTVSVCYSKGLGAPVGSVLVSSAANIARAREWRKQLGGGWRQAGMLAAGALYALDHHVARLADDHEAARALAAELPDQPVPETNMVMITTQRPAEEIVAGAGALDVRVLCAGPHTVRAVTSLEVTVEQCRRAGQVLAGQCRRGPQQGTGAGVCAE